MDWAALVKGAALFFGGQVVMVGALMGLLVGSAKLYLPDFLQRKNLNTMPNSKARKPTSGKNLNATAPRLTAPRL